MPNFKEQGGTYKGLVGEILFVSSHNGFLFPRFHPKWKYLPNAQINDVQKEFLNRNWYSIDDISWDGTHIVEVKTRNRYAVTLPYRPKASLRSLQILIEAAQLGFNVNIATVWLEDNRDYSIEIEPFDMTKVSIDRKKPYDGGAFKEEG